MAVKLIANYSKRLGLPGYSSHQFSVSVETELNTTDDLAFNGEVKLSRKHTRYAMRDLRQLTARAVGQFSDKFHELDRRIVTSKQKTFCDFKLRYIENS